MKIAKRNASSFLQVHDEGVDVIWIKYNIFVFKMSALCYYYYCYYFMRLSFSSSLSPRHKLLLQLYYVLLFLVLEKNFFLQSFLLLLLVGIYFWFIFTVNPCCDYQQMNENSPTVSETYMELMIWIKFDIIFFVPAYKNITHVPFRVSTTT